MKLCTHCSQLTFLLLPLFIQQQLVQHRTFEKAEKLCNNPASSVFQTPHALFSLHTFSFSARNYKPGPQSHFQDAIQLTTETARSTYRVNQPLWITEYCGTVQIQILATLLHFFFFLSHQVKDFIVDSTAKAASRHAHKKAT